MSRRVLPNEPIDERTRAFQEDRTKVGAVSPSEPIDRFPAVLSPFDFNKDVARVVGDKLVAARVEIAGNADVLTSDTPSDEVEFWKKKMAADLRTCVLIGTVRAELPDADTRATFDTLIANIATTGDYAGLSQKTAQDLSDRLYGVYDPKSTAPANARLSELFRAQDGGIATSFGITCTAIHEAMQKVVCKSIGFSLPGAGADVVV